MLLNKIKVKVNSSQMAFWNLNKLSYNTIDNMLTPSLNETMMQQRKFQK